MTQDANAIRKQMARIRRELDEDVESVVEGAKELADWRNFVRRHPLISVTAAAAVGFLVVPSRLQIMTPDAAELQKLAKTNRLVVKPRADVRRQASGGLLNPVVGMIASAVLRKGLTMAGEHFAKTVGQAGPLGHAAGPADAGTTSEGGNE